MYKAVYIREEAALASERLGDAIRGDDQTEGNRSRNAVFDGFPLETGICQAAPSDAGRKAEVESFLQKRHTKTIAEKMGEPVETAFGQPHTAIKGLNLVPFPESRPFRGMKTLDR